MHHHLCSVVRNVVILENGTTTQQLLQHQKEQQQKATSSTTTTTTVTLIHTVNGNDKSPVGVISNGDGNTTTTTVRRQTLVNGNVVNDKTTTSKTSNGTATVPHNKLANLKLNDALTTTGTNTQITQKVDQINGLNGERGQVLTTTVHTVSNGYKEEGNKKIHAKGSADVKQSNAASGSCNTVVSADGTTTTTVRSAKSSSVKYAVEASSVQEEIIR